MAHRLKKYYFSSIVPQLMSISKLNYKNKQQVPRIQKIVINRGLGDASQNEQILNSSQNKYQPVYLSINMIFINLIDKG